MADFKSAIAGPRVALGLVLLGLVALAVPNPVIESVAAENPTAANVWAGDAVATAADTLGTSHRYFALRTANVATAPAHRAGWEVAPGAAFTVYFKTWTDGLAPPAVPSGGQAQDACTLFFRYDNSATQQGSGPYGSTTCPADGTSYTRYCTDTGLVGGTPMAGTLRIIVRARDHNGAVDVYNVDSDLGTINKGAIRCGTTISSITANAYPAGSTFAYTVAGESITWTVGITASTSAQLRTYISTPLDSTGAVPAGFVGPTTTATAGATSFTTSGVAVSDAWPAASDTYGLRVKPTGNSALTGVKWTHVHAAIGPVVLDDDATVHRPTFYNVDPRGTATHLLQVNDAAFGSPPMSKDIGTTRLNDDIGRYATRFTNARGEGLVGGTLTFTSTLQDDGLVLAADTASGLTVGTQGGEAGWSTLRLWNNGAPLGAYTKTVDLTAPTTIDANTHLLVAALAYELDMEEGGGGGETIYVNSTSVADPLTVSAGYWNGTTVVAVQSMLLDARALEGVAELIDIDIWREPGHILVVDSANPVEVGLGSYRYENNTLPDGIYFIRTTTPHPDNGTVGADNVVVVDNALTDHREKSLELTMNNDFAGLGFDGFAFALFWLVGLIYFLRQAKSFCAGACTLGIFVSIFLDGFGGWTQAGVLLILSFMVWLEATTRDRLYQRILGQEPGDKKA